jgi:hypothetical protein
MNESRKKKGEKECGIKKSQVLPPLDPPQPAPPNALPWPVNASPKGQTKVEEKERPEKKSVLSNLMPKNTNINDRVTVPTRTLKQREKRKRRESNDVKEQKMSSDKKKKDTL